ncbi:MAG: hypothetical protein COA91_12460 [Robiginitomaculum sp.]|nr:MAG: hypothetical protein COA91_12460 [Robiginitomaculum sp.]
MPYIEFTRRKLKEITASLESVLTEKTFCIVGHGSYAREEACEDSDIDFQIIYSSKLPDDKDEVEEIQKIIINELQKHVSNLPSQEGAFNSVTCLNDMIINIGGEHDLNGKMTRRMLLLLESVCLYNSDCYEFINTAVIESYASLLIEDTHLTLLLLNDIIRLYRTICVDFNYKTIEGDKPWGIRKVKLVFSRKLLYFSGVASVAETVNLSAWEKRKKIAELFKLKPTDRIESIFGEQSKSVLTSYKKFMDIIIVAENRQELKEVTPDTSTHTQLYIELKKQGRVFTDDLIALFRNRYEEAHEIRRMILM